MPLLQYSKEMVDIILDDEFVTSTDCGFRLLLVKWHDCPDSDATWIHNDDLRHLDHSLLEYYLSSHSSELSSFQPKGNDRHRVGLDKIGSPNPMVIFIIIRYLFNRNFWICLLGFSVGIYQ